MKPNVGHVVVLLTACLLGSSAGCQSIQVGGLDGAIRTGRALDYLEKGDENRKLCSLYLSIMDGLGVKVPRFGDADTRLAGF